MHWYFTVWERHADFDGRSRRCEYWYFILFNFFAFLIVWTIDLVLGTRIPYFVYALAAFVPSLAVHIRRLHDTNRSGWWLLGWLIPVIGWIVMIVFYCQDSQPGDNRFGPDPKVSFASAA